MSLEQRSISALIGQCQQRLDQIHEILSNQYSKKYMIIAKGGNILIDVKYLNTPENVNLSTEDHYIVNGLLGSILDKSAYMLLGNGRLYEAMMTWEKICNSNISDDAINEVAGDVIYFFHDRLPNLHRLITWGDADNLDRLEKELRLFDAFLADLINISSSFNATKFVEIFKDRHPFVYKLMH